MSRLEVAATSALECQMASFASPKIHASLFVASGRLLLRQSDFSQYCKRLNTHNFSYSSLVFRTTCRMCEVSCRSHLLYKRNRPCPLAFVVFSLLQPCHPSLHAMADSSSYGTLASSSEDRKEAHTNRLASEQSPYLLQHAHNPVDWYPWGEDAFLVAQAKNVPIFLSIGYSTCHWCHVMEVESFENLEIAKLLNESFVCIKVDREERPDVDKVYMTFIQAAYGGGGWPLSVFLAPDLTPLVGGTYFPPEDKYGRPGFKTVIRNVKKAWDGKKEKLVEGGKLVIDQLSKALSATSLSKKLVNDVNAVEHCAEQLTQSYDSRYGGFGSAPKFPRPVEIQLMLYYSKKLHSNGQDSIKASESQKMVSFSLQGMADGGIHDHIGGGFHRYSVDERWHVPHFEKMLYDQAQLANVYLDNFCTTKDVFFANIARDILDYLRRNMIGKDGEIYSAEDADSAESEGTKVKKEGAFYVWTYKEVEEVLGDQANLFINQYYIKSSGNCDLSRLSDPHNEFLGKNVLIMQNPIPELASNCGLPVDSYLDTLGECRKKLFDVRNERPKPHLDDKVIVAWNGLTISAFARASQILQNQLQKQYNFPVVGSHPKDYLNAAEKAALFIKSNLYDCKMSRLQHCYRSGPSKAPAIMDDYAFLISGLLDLYEFGGSFDWLVWAMELQDKQDELFWDQSGGGYFNTTEEDPSVLLRVKEDHDGAEPSGNSVSAINLIRLSHMVGESKSVAYRGKAEHLLAVFESRLKDMPMAVPLMCCATDMISVPSWKQVVIVSGSNSSKKLDDMLTAAHSSYDPNKTVLHINVTNVHELTIWEQINTKIAEMAKNNSDPDKVIALVCQNFTCQKPVSDSNSLRSLLAKISP